LSSDDNNKTSNNRKNVNKGVKRKKDSSLETSKEGVAINPTLDLTTNNGNKNPKKAIDSSHCNETIESIAMDSHSHSSADSSASVNNTIASALLNSNEKSKKKKSKTAFTGRQIFDLEKQFEIKKYLPSSERTEMAKLLDATECVRDYLSSDDNNKTSNNRKNVNKGVKRKKDSSLETLKEGVAINPTLDLTTSNGNKNPKKAIDSSYCNETIESIAMDSHSHSSADSNASIDNTVASDSLNSNDKSKKKKARTTFTGRQIFELEKQFEIKKYLSSSERAEMAKLLNVTETQVSHYFTLRFYDHVFAVFN
ncbi:unnamed protein product, partial [Medioppia subpectinata]